LRGLAQIGRGKAKIERMWRVQGMNISSLKNEVESG